MLTEISMSSNATTSDKADAPTEVQKRAMWEAFEFAVPEVGTVRVANHSHGADEVDEHTYDISIEYGSAVACTCPADEHRPEACKHRVAVEANAPVLAAASGVVADGGEVVQEDSDDDEDPCECDGLDEDLLECFYCFEVTADEVDDSDDHDHDRPQRSEPADFGGGESSGVQDLLGDDS